MECIRILIADDHTLFRDGLRALFASLPDLEVVGEAGNGAHISILDNTVTNPPRTLRLSLSAPTGGAVIGAVTNATLTILDNDSTSDTVGFDFANFNVVENAAQASF